MTTVLVARQDNMGDVLLAGPAVRAVAASGARVVFLAGPNGSSAAAMLPGVDRVVTHRAEWIDPNPERLTRRRIDGFVDALADLHVDEALVLTSFHQSPLPLALLLRMAGVGRIAAISDDYPGSLLDVRHRVPDDVHEVERALSLAAAAGYRLPPGDDARLWVNTTTGPLPQELSPGRYVVVHPGASESARTFPPGRWAAVAAQLSADGWTVAVTGSASEAGTCDLVCGAGSSCLNLCGSVDLPGLALVLEHAAVLVSGNTGPAHLAAAVGTPVVSVFPPTVPASRWRPWRTAHLVLGEQMVPCAGCRARRCPHSNGEGLQSCLSAVSDEDVSRAVFALTGIAPRRVAAVGVGL